MLHLSFLDQILHCPRHILDRDGGVDTVLIKQIDRINSESLERCLGHLFDTFGATIHTSTGAGGGILEPELCCDHHSFLEGSEGFANELFVLARTINLCGVEEANAPFKCLP